MSGIAFNGTQEQKDKLLSVINTNLSRPGFLMPILQQAQDIYGYLPFEVQKIISDETKVSMEDIYGIITFYAQFTTVPKGKHEISCCMGTACYVKGSQDILDKFIEKLGINVGETTADGNFSLNDTRCVGACGLAPVIIIDGDVYSQMVPDRVEEVLAKYQ